MKKVLIILVAIVLIALAYYFLIYKQPTIETPVINAGGAPLPVPINPGIIPH